MALPQNLSEFAHDEVLNILARAESDRLKSFAEPLLAFLPDILVQENCTGLVMLPMRDTAQGTNFHLGEVLVSEARISCQDQIGYGMRKGRDLEAAMAMAVVDLAIASGIEHQACSAFLTNEQENQHQQDHDRLCEIEATRVNMETF